MQTSDKTLQETPNWLYFLWRKGYIQLHRTAFEQNGSKSDGVCQTVFSNTMSNSRFLILNQACYTQNLFQQSCILSRTGKRLHSNSSSIQQLFCIKHLCFHYVYFLGYLERDHSKETLVRSQRISPKDIDIVLPYILECATEVSKWVLEGTQLKQQLSVLHWT